MSFIDIMLDGVDDDDDEEEGTAVGANLGLPLKRSDGVDDDDDEDEEDENDEDEDDEEDEHDAVICY